MLRRVRFWLLAEVCLSSQVIGSVILQERQSNSCPSADYTAANGLTFTTADLCLHNVPGGDISQEITPNLTACMDLCSAAPASKACMGVSYTISTGRCWMKNSTVLSAPVGASSGTHSALTTNFQIQQDVTCPYNNETVITTVNGMRLRVLCHTNMQFNDYCTTDSPRPERKPGVCPFHADTLEECMDVCSKSVPLCQGVSWNPDMSSGYGNCYPKTEVSLLNVRAVPSRVPTSHMAVVVNIPSLSPDCSSDAVIAASSGVQFRASCNDNRAGNDLIQVHAENMNECADACATFNNTTSGACVGAIFDSTMRSGWQNCWLKSEPGSTQAIAGNHYLSRTTASSNPGDSNGGNGDGSDSGGSTNPPASSGSEESDGSSNAWIAGAVIGPIAAVALIAFAVWFLRRHRASPATTAPQELSAEGHVVPYKAEKVAPIEVAGAGMMHQELPAHDEPVHELPGNVR